MLKTNRFALKGEEYNFFLAASSYGACSGRFVLESAILIRKGPFHVREKQQKRSQSLARTMKRIDQTNISPNNETNSSNKQEKNRSRDRTQCLSSFCKHLCTLKYRPKSTSVCCSGFRKVVFYRAKTGLDRCSVQKSACT